MSYVLELLDNTGIKVAQLGPEECSVSVKRKINADWTISISYPIPQAGQGENKTSFFDTWGARARILNTKNSVDYSTFILNTPVYNSNSGKTELLITGEHISIVKMRSEIIADHIDFQGVSANVALQKIFSHSSYIVVAAGIITPVTIKISWESVLSAFQKIISACSIEYDFDESEGEIIVKSALGVTDKYISIRSGKNLKSLKITKKNQDVINCMYGVGSGEPPTTIAGARHNILAIDGDIITLDSSRVVPEKGSWNSYKAKHESGSFNIISSVHNSDNDTLQLSGDISELQVGDSVVMCDPSNTPVNYIRAGQSIALRGEVRGVYKNTKYDNTVNLVKNSDFTDLSHWAASGSVFLNVSDDNVLYGEHSLEITANEIGAGIYQDIAFEDGKYYSVFVQIYIQSGSSRLHLTMDGIEYPLSIISSTGWQTIRAKVKANGDTLRLKIVSGSESSVFYADAALVAETSFIDNALQDRSYVKNCGQIGLWNEVFDKLMTTKNPEVEYVANFIDLHRAFPGDYPFDSIDIGDTVLITDDNLKISNVPARVTEISFDPFNPELTEHTIKTGK